MNTNQIKERMINHAQRKPLQLDIQEGTLRNYMKRKYGSKAFKEDGKLNITFLRQLETKEDTLDIIKRRIRLYLKCFCRQFVKDSRLNLVYY
jgi:hypothetical protein